MSLSRREFGKVLAVAVGGVLASSAIACKTDSGKAAVEKHACKGLNNCKGQGGCSTGDAGCNGKNSCAKKGGCATAEKHSCGGKNACKGQGGCKTGDNGCAGKNSCAKKGGCAVPVGKH